LPSQNPSSPVWLAAWMRTHDIPLWGAADLRECATPEDAHGQGFAFALAFALPMNPLIMAAIHRGPTFAYADEYARVNGCINAYSTELEGILRGRDVRAQALSASERTDPVGIRGDFPHKTAATLAGLGWIGRHCQLVTRRFGPWIRLGTVFTDMKLPLGVPFQRSFCGTCTRCVEACPADALTGRAWHPGLPRDAILDAAACDRWKKEHYFQYHKGHNCGICAAVCPYGLNTFRH